jgi:hypothetical protein
MILLKKKQLKLSPSRVEEDPYGGRERNERPVMAD